MDLEPLGKLIDTCDNYLEYTQGGLTSLPTEMRLNAMSYGLADIRQALYKFYIAHGGVDVWDSTGTDT